MNGFTRDQLRKLAEMRTLPTCERLGMLPAIIIEQMIGYYKDHIDENVLAASIEKRHERNVPMANDAYLQNNYRQVALQGLRQGGNSNSSLDYTIPFHEASVAAVRAIAGQPHRMRISGLDPGATLPEHIDAPDQIRAIVLLAGRQEFVLRTRYESTQIDMQIGELWYVNTAWHHSVVNPGSVPRLALMVDISDEKLITRLQSKRRSG